MSILNVVRRTSSNWLTRSVVTLASPKYSVTATAVGAGRNGVVHSNGFEARLAMPKVLGGSGDGQNPEQLFAMGYASCLLGAIQLAARNAGKGDMAKKAMVEATVHLGEPVDMPGFGLAVDLKVTGVDEETAKAGHELCPYSRALNKGVVVNLTVA